MGKLERSTFKCEDCDGTGNVNKDRSKPIRGFCPVCHGKGKCEGIRCETCNGLGTEGEWCDACEGWGSDYNKVEGKTGIMGPESGCSGPFPDFFDDDKKIGAVYREIARALDDMFITDPFDLKPVAKRYNAGINPKQLADFFASFNWKDAVQCKMCPGKGVYNNSKGQEQYCNICGIYVNGDNPPGKAPLAVQYVRIKLNGAATETPRADGLEWFKKSFKSRRLAQQVSDFHRRTSPVLATIMTEVEEAMRC